MGILDLGTYSYDARSEPISDSGPQKTWQYRYDPIGRLEQVRDPASQRTRRYVFDLDSNRQDSWRDSGGSPSGIGIR